MSTDFWIQASCPQWLRLTRHDIISNSSAALLVETLAKYHGQVKPWAGVAIQPSQITARELQLAIPAGVGSPAQMNALEAAAQRAAGQGVRVTVTPIE